MDEMEFTEAESNMNDLISEYQQYQVRPSLPPSLPSSLPPFLLLFHTRSPSHSSSLPSSLPPSPSQDATVDEEEVYDEEEDGMLA